MRIAEHQFHRAGQDAARRTSKSKLLRHAGAGLLGLVVVLACSANAVAQQTIWPSTSVPATVDNGPDSPVELGVSFKTDTAGTVTAIRFYKSVANGGLHVGHLWSPTGALLATVTFTGETASGWQQANFSTPVAIKANTVYVASYQTQAGHWSVNWNYFATSGASNPPLHALQNGKGAPDGVYGIPGAFPTHTNSANYWIDVVFKSAVGTAPSITAQPASRTVIAGQSATFSVAATGTAPLTYQWTKNSVAISGANSSSYTTAAATSSDDGAQFAVKISNAAGTANSNAATLKVNVAPSVSAQPASQTVTAGQTASFTVAASGTAPLTYQWQKNGFAISAATAATYLTPATTTADNGAQFTVTISNPAGSLTSSAASLFVKPLLPIAEYGFDEGTGNTTADSSGNGNRGTLSGPSWTTAGRYGDALSFNATDAYVEAANSNSLNPGTAATFSAWVNLLGSNADISSIINKWGQTVDDEYLFGLDSSNRLTFAWQTTGGNVWGQPSYYVVTGNAQVPLSTWTYVTVVRNGPAISFYINGNLDASFSAVADANPFRSGINTIRIGGQSRGGMARVLNGTIDEVRMYNQALTPAQIQSDMSAPIITPAIPPSIATQPISQSVTVGQTATFSVIATGTAPLSYQWQKNGTAISGATSASYTTAAASTSDNAAQFLVLVSNSAGSVTSSAATLIVNAPLVAPLITTQPNSQTITAGQTATFLVTASGTAPLSYQWQRNGTPISGAASASYTTPATTTTDNGAQFTVAVSNSAGSVISSAATLTVNPPPAPGIQVSPASVNFGNSVAGSTFSQVLIIANTGTATLSITQVTETGSAFFTASGFSLPLSVAAGKQTTITAAFLPTSVGAASGSISIVSNAPGSPLAIPLSGAGVAATFLVGANPTSLGFGNVNLGSNSSLSTTLTNTGNSTVTISSVSVFGAGFSASGVAAGTSLTPRQSATLNVTFAPAAAGSVTGSVTFSSNATNSPATITLSGAGLPSAPPAFPVWVSSSLVRVGPTDAPGTVSSGDLSGARGETVDTQVIVQAPAGGLTNVNLSVSALVSSTGATIPASNVTLYREYYLTVTGTAGYGGGSNPPQGSGTYPEPLIPFQDPVTGAALCASSASLKACNATISAGQNQPYWIDISIPRGATNSPPGTYTGSISITATQGTVTIPVTLTVWNFELPVQPSELSIWSLFPPAVGNTTTLAQALMRNKVMGWYDVAANAPPDITNFGLNRSGLDGTFYIGINCSGGYSSLPSSAQIASAAATFPAGLPLDLYAADELQFPNCSGAVAPLKTLAANAHASGVKVSLTTNAVYSGLQGAIDHWVLLDSVEQWPSLPYTGGGDLWSYATCNTGFGNTPEWMVDYPPINERIQAGFLNWTQEATGILYWRSDGWTAGNTIGSWNNVDTTGCGDGLGRPGDGIFLYPPGPIASTESAPGIRLKAIRDGIQDYQYAQMLKNLGQVTFVNSTVQPIAASWSNWTHDPKALEAARLQLGQQLHQLAP